MPRESVSKAEWFMTEPLDASAATKRGDPLGFRKIANHFADLLAPNLSNGTIDARWITILSWCLHMSHRLRWDRNNEGVGTSEARRRRYDWLKPLELLWIARTCILAEDNRKGRQLRYVNRVKSWDREQEHFNLHPTQWDNYRARGIYAAYGTLFRSVPGLTQNTTSNTNGLGDGYTPDTIADRLATIAKEHGDLPLFSNVRTPPPRMSPERYWLGRTSRWKNWNNGSTRFLPTHIGASIRSRNDQLFSDEKTVITRLLFGNDDNAQRREAVVAAIKRREGKQRPEEHKDMCVALAADTTLRRSLSDEQEHTVVVLGRFAQFADAAIMVLRTIFVTAANGNGRRVRVQDLCNDDMLRRQASTLKRHAQTWRRELRHRDGLNDRLWDPVYTLANALVSLPRCRTRGISIVKVLVTHHTAHTEKRWLWLSGEYVHAEESAGQDGPSYYRFRLFALCRLALQCGLINRIPRSIEETPEYEEELD